MSLSDTSCNRTSGIMDADRAVPVYFNNCNQSNASNDSNGNNNTLSTAQQTVYAVTVSFAVIIVLAGLVANALVFFVIVRNRGMRRTVHNVYLANLSITDFMYLAIVGVAVVFEYAIQASTGQKISNAAGPLLAVQFITVAATCSALAALAFDRYFAIVHPLRARTARSVKYAMIINGTIWIGSVAFAVVLVLFLAVIRVPATICLSILLIFTYVLPLIVILMCYVSIYVHVAKAQFLFNKDSENARQLRKKMRLLRLIACVVASFGLCWGPWYIVQFLVTQKIFQSAISKQIGDCVATLLILLNSALNPFLYAGTNSKLAARLRRALKMTSHVEESSTDMPLSTRPKPDISRNGTSASSLADDLEERACVGSTAQKY